MRFKEIQFSRTVNLGDNNFQKVGAVIVVNEGENPMQAIDEANIFCIEAMQRTHGIEYGAVKLITHELEVGFGIEDLNSCEDIVVLNSYKLLVKGKPELEAAFMKKAKELSCKQKK